MMMGKCLFLGCILIVLEEQQSNQIQKQKKLQEVQRVMNKYNTPLLGFYSGVEVAPILGKSRGLDWTGVLMVLAEDK